MLITEMADFYMTYDLKLTIKSSLIRCSISLIIMMPLYFCKKKIVFFKFATESLR